MKTKASKKEEKPGRTNRKYPVALRREVKALSVKVNISMEDLEIIFIRYGIKNAEDVIEEVSGYED